MSDHYFVAMDSETGGLSPKKSDILTLYVAIVDMDFKIIDELDLKLKPDGRLPVADAGALEVNGIDLKKHLEDPNTKYYSEAAPLLMALFKKYLKKSGRFSNLIPLGQNVVFDIAFVKQHLIDEETWDATLSYNVEDTKSAGLFLKRAGWIPPDIGTLKSFVEFFNIPKRNAHEAKGDVLMTVDVYRAMCELMKSKKDGGTTQDLISLLESE